MNNQKGLVSVIIPVYNTDPILMEKCFRNLSEQTYEKLEILVINDGSTKKETLSFLKKIETSIKNIKVINKGNGGVSSARNKGLEEAKGEYIYFLDSDDYIGRDTIRKLVEIMDSGEYVEAISRQKIVSGNTRKELGHIPEGTVDVVNNNRLVLLNTINFASHGTLVRASIAKKYTFDEGVKYGEDFQYNYKIMTNGESYFTNKCDYYYCQNPNSALNSINKINANRYLKDFNSIYKEIFDNSNDTDLVCYMMCDKINLTLKRICNLKMLGFAEYRKMAKQYRCLLLSDRYPKSKAGIQRDILVFLYYKKIYILHYFTTFIWHIVKRLLVKVRQ